MEDIRPGDCSARRASWSRKGAGDLGPERGAGEGTGSLAGSDAGPHVAAVAAGDVANHREAREDPLRRAAAAAAGAPANSPFQLGLWNRNHCVSPEQLHLAPCALQTTTLDAGALQCQPCTSNPAV